MNRTQKSF